MTDTKGIVNIHGRDYMTVARRVELAHEAQDFDALDTEVLSHMPVVVKAIVTIKGKVYTGISAVDPNNAKMIERQSPYEVAETSAVGRALGFAGYGSNESIASADEIIKADTEKPLSVREMGDKAEEASKTASVTNPAPKTTTDPYAGLTIGQLKLQLSQLINDGMTPVKHEDVGAMSREEVIAALNGEYEPPVPHELVCEVCGDTASDKRGTTKAGKAWHGIFCSTGDKSHTRWLWN